jgi:hypothetical protein
VTRRNGTSGTNGTAGKRQDGPARVDQESTGAAAPDSGRDPRTGQYRKGFSGNPAGSPVMRKVALLRRTILTVVGEEEIRDLFRSLLNHARHGNMEAAKLVLQYSVGKAPTYDPDGDAQEGSDGE